MQVVITGANGEKAVYELGSGEAADKNYITYTAGNAVITADLPENVRYTVAVSGAGYRTAKKSVVLKMPQTRTEKQRTSWPERLSTTERLTFMTCRQWYRISENLT